MRNEGLLNFSVLSKYLYSIFSQNKKIGGKKIEIISRDSNLSTYEKNQDNPIIIVTQNLRPMNQEIETNYGIDGSDIKKTFYTIKS